MSNPGGRCRNSAPGGSAAQADQAELYRGGVRFVRFAKVRAALQPALAKAGTGSDVWARCFSGTPTSCSCSRSLSVVDGRSLNVVACCGQGQNQGKLQIVVVRCCFS